MTAAEEERGQEMIRGAAAVTDDTRGEKKEMKKEADRLGK